MSNGYEVDVVQIMRTIQKEADEIYGPDVEITEQPKADGMLMRYAKNVYHQFKRGHVIKRGLRKIYRKIFKK